MKKIREYFDITGYFYEIKEYSFRKYLNIKRKGTNASKPDLMVVMMNPGSSRQEKEFAAVFDKEVPTIPDNTQDQIMRVLNNINFSYARILNLSDIRESKSKIFYEKINVLDKKNISHSIFEEKRTEDFEKLFVKNLPVICAWGVNEKLTPLANLTINKIKNQQIIGIKKETVTNAYYHPLPQNYTKQKEWVEKISSEFV